jgi:hypothetical protein
MAKREFYGKCTAKADVPKVTKEGRKTNRGAAIP